MCGLPCLTRWSVSTARETFPSISAACVWTVIPLPCIVALSVHTRRFIATGVLSSYTERYRCIAWRFVCASNSPLPFHSHHPQYWRDGFFDRTSLHSLGLICHLGHNGDPCSINTQSCDLTIVDMNGWHKVRVKFCACDTSAPWHERYRQLLRMRWYPASFSHPRTAFSFDLLETYHKLTLQGKLNLYDFYLAIMQKLDNQGRLKTTVSDF